MKFSHKYKLLKDLPTYKKGWTLKWSGNNEKFYPYKQSEYNFDNGKESIYLDIKHQGYTLDEIKNTDWFEPIGEKKDFIPNFPSNNKIEEFVYLYFETRLTNDVDECRAMNKLFETKKFQNDLYEFVKEKYNEFYKLAKE